MQGPLRIEGYAIMSADGMIGNSTGLMPNSLKFNSDQRLIDDAFDRAAVVVHGRLSFEDQANSSRRRRLILTRRVAGIAPDPDNPNARLWNPAGACLEHACEALGCKEGMVAVAGGTDIFSLFLKGYDAFYLVRADQVWLPGGVPTFAQGRFGQSPNETLKGAGLRFGKLEPLEDNVTLTVWTRGSGGPST